MKHRNRSPTALIRHWAILPDMLSALPELTPPANAAAAAPELLGKQQDGVAIVPLRGVVMADMPWWAESFGYTDPQTFASRVMAAASNPSVKAIILDINSPGGTVAGTERAGLEVARAAALKPVYAVISGMGCSAAYWIASQASKIIAEPSSIVGSLGVITKHYDYSGYLEQEGIKPTIIRTGDLKALGQPEEAMTETMLDSISSELDDLFAVFVGAVAVGRKMPEKEVRKRWGDGGTKVGTQALEDGLIDELGYLGDVVASELSKLSTTARRAGMEDGVKLTIKTRSGRLLEIDTEATTAQADLQAAFDADIEAAHNDGIASAQSQVIQILQIERGVATRDVLNQLRLEAADGRAYRADLEQRFTQASIRAFGQERGAKHSETALKAFKHLETTELEEQIALLEEQAANGIPSGRVSKDDQPTITPKQISGVDFV
jgi:signal peptide peptidase SppA